MTSAGAPPPTPGTPAEKLALLSERMKGAALLGLLHLTNKPAPEALVQRVTELRNVVFGLCQHLAPDDPIRTIALERLKSAEALVQNPLEIHILLRAQELKQDAADPQVRALIEAAFYEEHVPRTIWQGGQGEAPQSELRKSLRLPVLMDVELDIGGGRRARCQTTNLSRTGASLDVPAGFGGNAVNMVIHLPGGAQIPLTANVVWRDAGRIGVAFKLEPVEQNAIDGALTAHYAALQRTVDRWREVAPKSSAAVACAAIVGYASSALPSSRRDHIDRLAAAAQGDPTAKELQLALCKLRLDEGDFDGAAQSLKRIVLADRADPRYRLLELTLAQRRGRGGPGFRGAINRAIAAARVPLIVLAIVGLAGAGTFAAVALHGPYVAIGVPSGGLPCATMKLLDSNALCFMDAARYKQITAADKTHQADITLQALTPRGVRQVTVFGLNQEGILDMFDEYSLKATRSPARVR